MKQTPWQYRLVEEAQNILSDLDGVKAIILVGSLADDQVEIDEWSDVDMKVIVDDFIMNAFCKDLSWIDKLGSIFSLEHVEAEYSHTLRICLDDFRRFDVTFITIENLSNMKVWGSSKKHKTIMSDLDNLEDIIGKMAVESYEGAGIEWLNSFQLNFWHKAVLAIVKLMRNDLLISSHLALDLARDCLVLKMNQRDEELGTNIHRTGRFENEFAKELFENIKMNSAEDILKNIEKYSKKFNELSMEIKSDNNKFPILKNFIDEAQAKISNI